MRLTCPNCSARYEVDDDMIPAEGRDVQCSNCSTTWFQPGLRSASEAIPGASAEDIAPDYHPSNGEEPPLQEDGPAEDGTLPGEDSQTDGESAEPADAPSRRELDPSLRELLREEAEREERLRRSATVETQEEMALNEADPQTTTSRADHPLNDVDENFDDEVLDDMIRATGSSKSRRDLLPDIEEINSTLRATGDRSANEHETSDVETLDEAPRRRRGAQFGFALIFLITVGMVVIYSNAGQIGDRLPQLRPALQSYVAQVNAIRFWLDDVAHGVLQGEGDIAAGE
ncbi:hypothetical protein E2K80_13790 [Rhodophyticola sp. CCM32]|uniref:zinc-ribbon domain-containing protein n=1 Tax=Rhodophyticola sp. CCM32 TaxID=2916397 RepID=UPI00107F48D7|nr:zinc-ribbon domain-containing protein [Rhodophyticola sp. CCM32]QBY01666.1 hypothetical protein E2K80_13790 [Rhodophyticola sp. CCM32]